MWEELDAVQGGRFISHEEFMRIKGQCPGGICQGAAEGAGIVEVLPQLGVLLGMSVVLYLIAIWRFRFE